MLAVVSLVVLQLGLPTWVVWGAVVLLAIGAPIIWLTGHHERRRAMAQTQGIPLTPQSGVRRHFTWRKAVLGGGLAFAGLAAASAGYMVLRSMGIGPVGTLVAAGMLDERGQLIVADFEDRTDDGSLGESVTEAFRIDLSQSPVVRIMDASAVRQALRRMEREPGEGLGVETAREVAQREGVKAIVAGDIGTLGRSYVVSARLLSSADGSELIALRETADDDAAIIGAVDRLSAKLRERIGESLKTIRANEPLERVTTASLGALRRYSRAVKIETEGDAEGAASLLREAVTLDSSFGMAYRKLAVVLSNAGAPQSQVAEAATRAFELRDRLPDIEGYLAAAYYYSNVAFDQSEIVRNYRAVLDLDPDETTALNNLSIQLSTLGRFAEAEELLRHGVEVDPALLPGYVNLADAQVLQGEFAAADSTVRRFEDAFTPDNPYVLLVEAGLDAARGDYSRAEERFARIGEVHRTSLAMRSLSLGGLASLAQMSGRIGLAEERFREAMAISEQQGDPGGYLENASEVAWQHLRFRNRPAAALEVVEDALERFPLDAIEPTDRPYSALAYLFAAAGRVDAAKALMREYAGEVDEAVRRGDLVTDFAVAQIAVAEGRGDDAIAAFRGWQERFPGSVILVAYALAEAFDMVGQADSAFAYYRRAIETPALFVRVYGDDRDRWRGLLRLGELYAERGEGEEAVEYYKEFVDLWADADAELQPLVEEVRGRIARLVGEG